MLIEFCPYGTGLCISPPPPRRGQWRGGGVLNSAGCISPGYRRYFRHRGKPKNINYWIRLENHPRAIFQLPFGKLGLFHSIRRQDIIDRCSISPSLNRIAKVNSNTYRRRIFLYTHDLLYYTFFYIIIRDLSRIIDSEFYRVSHWKHV